ncbi:MAG: RNA-binding S4 domain-containing protein [Bacteroidales bacterium]|nr:RNA-binding S4 domain-containing protein [Bacteroidales bacterium]
MGKSEVRVDKWLWATRVFKTRSIATDACKKGRVTISGMNVKPSHGVKIGDVINVRKPPITYSYEVIGLTENRVGAKLVPEYLKNITSKEQYDLLELTRISGFIDRQKGLGRPTKKEGRDLARFSDYVFMGYDDFDDDFDDDDDETDD